MSILQARYSTLRTVTNSFTLRARNKYDLKVRHSTLRTLTNSFTLRARNYWASANNSMSRTKLIQAIASIAPSRVSPATELRLHLPVCLAFTGLSRDLVVEHLPKCSSNNLFIYERLYVGTGQNHKQHVRQRRCSIANTCGSGDLLHLVSDPPLLRQTTVMDPLSVRFLSLSGEAIDSVVRDCSKWVQVDICLLDSTTFRSMRVSKNMLFADAQ